MSKRVILKGQRFGRWTVIREAASVRYGRIVIRHFVCRCICGAIQTLPLTNLSTDASRGCMECSAKNRIKISDEKARTMQAEHASGLSIWQVAKNNQVTWRMANEAVNRDLTI